MLAYDLAKRWGVSLVFLIFLASNGGAADIEKLPKSQATLFSRLYLVFPTDEAPEPEQPKVDNPTPWQIRIWATNEAEECTYENQLPACKGFTMYFSISDDELGGKTFGFRTRKAFQWSVNEIRYVAKDQATACAAFVLRERLPSREKKGEWSHRETNVCASPNGFVQ